MTLTLGHFLALGAMLFSLSVIGIFLNRRNLIVLLMAIELMLLAVNMNFVAFSYYLGDMHGQIFVFFILTVAAAEAAIAAVEAAVQTHGGNGVSAEFGLMPYWGLARLLRIAPVSREMILNFVAMHSLGLPKSY